MIPWQARGVQKTHVAQLEGTAALRAAQVITSRGEVENRADKAPDRKFSNSAIGKRQRNRSSLFTCRSSGSGRLLINAWTNQAACASGKIMLFLEHVEVV